jgi:hypothetical protein
MLPATQKERNTYFSSFIQQHSFSFLSLNARFVRRVRPISLPSATKISTQFSHRQATGTGIYKVTRLKQSVLRLAVLGNNKNKRKKEKTGHFCGPVSGRGHRIQLSTVDRALRIPPAHYYCCCWSPNPTPATGSHCGGGGCDRGRCRLLFSACSRSG